MYLLYLLCLILARLFRLLHLGTGSTWPGEIATRIFPGILAYCLSRVEKKVILVGGTNGKTTTAAMIAAILRGSGQHHIVHNASGANLENGIVSAFLLQGAATPGKLADWAVLEVDENIVPLTLRCAQGKPVTAILLNLFRDQLDRYGEVDAIAKKWQESLEKLDGLSCVIVNADDPQLVYSTRNVRAEVRYFGLDDPDLFLPAIDHATDSLMCPKCGHELAYRGTYLSHLGIWHCPACRLKRPIPETAEIRTSLLGLYNRYNAMASALTALSLSLPLASVKKALQRFTPAFGRQEDIVIEGKHVKVFLSKNPTGFNASLRAVLSAKPTVMLLLLNDRIPDGRDVSWIWDVDFETLPASVSLILSGDRVYDLALRIKYADVTAVRRTAAFEETADAVRYALDSMSSGETLYVLPTYSAMLEVRKILKGRKLL